MTGIFPRLALAALLVVVCGCSRGGNESGISDSVVNITIGGPTRDVSGISWPTGNMAETLAIETPRTITVRFPSGRMWTCHSTITFLSQEEKAISQVEVAPLKHSTDFASAVSELEEILNELSVAADNPARQRVKDWQAQAPGWSPFASQSLAVEVVQGVKLFAEIKPTSEENKWFLLCSFTASRFFEPADDR